MKKDKQIAYPYLKPKSLRALKTTINVEPSCAITAGPILANPNKVSGTRIITIPILINKFCFIIDLAFLPRAIAKGRLWSLSASNATSAVSNATSEPAAHIAIHTFAVAIAGASLTPSPIIATL
ncbi:MAG: hypothetical protein ABIP69_07350 [Ferruginibacter sp.]